MRKISSFLVVTAIAVFAVTSIGYADIAHQISYQGMLKNTLGQPITDTLSMTFNIYGDSAHTQLLWSEIQPSVITKEGLFHVALGSINPIPDTTFDGGDTWMGIDIESPLLIDVINVGPIYPGPQPWGGPYWKLLGNYVAALDLNFLGTLNNMPLNLRVNNQRAFRIEPNTASPNIIGGYSGNNVGGGAYGATISGGGQSGGVNQVRDIFGAIGGGYNNTVSGPLCTIGGGYSNTSHHTGSVVSGGTNNEARADAASVGGGRRNLIDARGATICGGDTNYISNIRSVIGGGHDNTINGYDDVISGGWQNRTCEGRGFGVIAGGSDNFDSTNYSTILGGSGNQLLELANYSMVFGNNVCLKDDYRIAFFDSSHWGSLNINRDYYDGPTNSYPIQVGRNPNNGYGAYLTQGGTWTDGFGTLAPLNFQQLNGSDLLSRISQLSINAYTYDGTSEKHIGPTAQDFVNTFDVGAIRKSDGKRDDQGLAASDEAGVALAGVQELIKQIDDLKKEIAELKAQQGQR
jgi:hypothetical protein